MDKANFLELLQKYREGTATEEEARLLVRYYDLFDDEPDVLVLYNQEQKEELKNLMLTDIWQKVSENERPARKSMPLNRGWVTMIAAAVLVLAVFATLLIYAPNRSVEQINATAHKVHRFIYLPDASKVILGAGSSLKYLSSFDGLNNREVFLEGQAFFNIAHDARQPFIVHAGQLKTTVLGTSFNVKAWPAEGDIEVTVTKGKVEVGDQDKTLEFVTQDQQLTTLKGKPGFIKQAVKASDVVAWKEQDLLLDDVTVAEAAELLEERFNVRILCDELVRAKRFTTVFLKSESLEQVLESVCEFNDAVFHYDKAKARVLISSKK